MSGIVKVTYELMPNQIPGSTAPKQVSSQVVSSDQHLPIIFALNEAGALIVDVQDINSATGWTQLDLTAAVVHVAGGRYIQAFSVSQSTNGKLSIAAAVSATSTTSPTLKIVAGINLDNSSQPAYWSTILPQLFTVDVPPNHCLKTLEIGKTYAGVDVPLLAGHVNDLAKTPFETELIQFNLDVNTINSWQWDIFDKIDGYVFLDYAIGHLKDRGPGVYRLFDNNNAPGGIVIRFQNGISNDKFICDLTFGSDWTGKLITTVALGNSVATDLLVSGTSLYCLTAQDQVDGTYSPAICASQDFSPVSSIVATSDAAGTSLDIWTLDVGDLASNTSQLRHINGTSDGGEVIWLDPVAFTTLTRASTVSAYRLDDLDPTTNDAGVLVNGYDGSLGLWLEDSVTSLWRPHTISMTSSDVYIELETYTLSITLYDQDQQAWPDQAVHIQPSFDCAAFLNNKIYALPAASGMTFTTDAAGQITLVLETDSLAAPVMTVTANNGITVCDPTQNVIGSLRDPSTGAALSGEQIANAQCSDGSPLFTTRPSDKTTGAASAILEQLLEAHDSLPADGTLRKGATKPHYLGHDHKILSSLTIRFTPHGPKILRGEDSINHHKRIVGGSKWSFAGDVLKAIASKIKDVADFVINKLEEGYSFTVTIAGRAFQFMLDAISQTAEAIGTVLVKTLTIAWKKLVSWVGFVFGWTDILNNQKAIANMISVTMNHCASTAGTLTKQFDTYLDNLEKKIANNQVSINEDLDVFGDRARQANDTSKQADKASEAESPQSKWSSTQMSSNSNNAVIATPNLKDISALFKDIDGANIDTITSDIGDTIDDIINNFGTYKWSDVLNKVLGVAALSVISATKGFTDSIGKAMPVVIQCCQTIMNSRLNIPVLTWLFEKVICKGNGTQFTLLNAISLLAAVPATILFKIGMSRNLFSDHQAAALATVKDWDSMMKILESPTLGYRPPLHLGHKLQPSEFVPNRHLGPLKNNKLIRSGDWQAVTAISLQTVSQFLQTVSGVVDILVDFSLTNSKTKLVAKSIKMPLDWASFALTLVKTSIGYVSTDGSKSVRKGLDLTLATVPVLIRTIDTWRLVMAWQNNTKGKPYENSVLVKAIISLGLLVGSCVSITMQATEPIKDQVVEVRLLMGFKFISNIGSRLRGTFEYPQSRAEAQKNEAVVQTIKRVRLGCTVVNLAGGVCRTGMEFLVNFDDLD